MTENFRDQFKMELTSCLLRGNPQELSGFPTKAERRKRLSKEQCYSLGPFQANRSLVQSLTSRRGPELSESAEVENQFAQPFSGPVGVRIAFVMRKQDMQYGTRRYDTLSPN